MYAITAPRYIMDYESRCLVQNFSLIGADLKKLLSSIYLHSGRTDSSGGHKDKKNKSGLGAYHYHHGVSAYLHPDGVCPYGSKQTFIINPYTDKKISLGQPYLLPYYDENIPNVEYYSLNLVSKALTAHDSMGVELALNNTGGIFYACSTGDSLMTKLGEEFTFSYPTFLGFRQDNTLFETNKGKLQLLCHTKKAALDDVSCYAYISLETVCNYMMKDGYFTDFSDNGSGIWNFIVRKPSVKITYPNSSTPSFSVGDTLTVKANIDKVVYAKLTVGQHTESKDAHLNQSEVTFNDYTLKNEDTGNLTLKVEVNTGGTAIGAETVTSTVQIQVEGSKNVNIRTYSPEGLQFICDEEMTRGYAKAHGLLHIDNADNELGIYPHYVAGAGSNGAWADGVLTVGYGIAIPNESSTKGNHQDLIKRCNLSGKKFDIVTTQDFNNFYGLEIINYKTSTGSTSSVPFPVRVPNTNYVSFADAYADFEELLPTYVGYLNNYLDRFGIVITQRHHYDALLSLCYNTPSWTYSIDPNEYDFTKWLIDDPEKNAKLIGDEIASWRDNKARRRREGDLFEKAIYNPTR